MSFFGSIEDGSFQRNVSAHVSAFLDGLDVNAKYALIGLGHFAAAAAPVAEVVEAATGNAAVIPLTQEAAAAAVALGDGAASSTKTGAAGVVESVTGIANQVAAVAGTDSNVGRDAGKIGSTVATLGAVFHPRPS
jgi:hypothetical protein